MQRSQLRLAILMVIGVLLLGACNSFKLFHSTDDKAITTNIQAKLFSDPVLKTRDIRVDSRNGIVTLSGTVGTDLERSAVERIATQEDGVKNVVNMLSVASPSATPAPEGAQTAQSAAPAPASCAARRTATEEPAPEKPQHTHHAQPGAMKIRPPRSCTLIRTPSPRCRRQPHPAPLRSCPRCVRPCPSQGRRACGARSAGLQPRRPLPSRRSI